GKFFFGSKIASLNFRKLFFDPGIMTMPALPSCQNIQTEVHCTPVQAHRKGVWQWPGHLCGI
ncbi:MAG: hypothetical protein RR367_06185, partial [Clostridia bacterium]